MSTVLVATTLGAVVGPNLVTPLGEFARAWGLPPLTGPFLLAALAYGAAAAVLGILLRPDPLPRARSLAGADVSGDVSGSAIDRRPHRGTLLTAATVMIVAQLVMVAIMTMTPVHLLAHGHSVAAAGLVIAVHVGFMFLPSPLSGWLVDRVGARPVAAASGVTLLVAGLAAMAAPDPVAGAVGGMLSGVVDAGVGFATLALGGGLIALIAVAAVVLSAFHRARQL